LVGALVFFIEEIVYRNDLTVIYGSAYQSKYIHNSGQRSC
jgi:hypothetical protein